MTAQAGPPPADLAAAGPVSMAMAREWIGAGCLLAGPAGRVGVELELQVAARSGWAEPLPADQLNEICRALTGVVRHCGVTQEPGGQVELSLFPQAGIGHALSAAGADLRAVGEIAAEAGLRLAGIGLDPVRAPIRILDAPRYEAMEAYLDRSGSWGRVMMASTASVQVNIEAMAGAGTGASARAGMGQAGPARGRWWLLHLIGPALVAAFANSPVWRGRPTGWKCTRQAVWHAIDPARTAPVAAAEDEDPREAFSRYALAAPVMMVRRERGGWPVPAGLTFGGWIDGHNAAAGLRPPTLDDLAYHLTTLFPPVRPRGFLEVRYLDAQPARWWRAAAATVWSLAEDPRAADEAAFAAEPVNGQWRAAARLGPAEPRLGRAALGCLTAARDGLSRLGQGALAADVDAFTARYTARGRCPADDLLEQLDHLNQPSAVTASEVLP